MRKVKDKERKTAGNLYCSFCRPLKVNAIYRKHGSANHSNGFACEEHKHLIVEDKPESTDYSEADYQTWLRI